jgi:hypothetical protein
MRVAALLFLLVLAGPSCGGNDSTGTSSQSLEGGPNTSGSGGTGEGGQTGTASERDGSIEAEAKVDAGAGSEGGASEGAAGSGGLIYCKVQSDCPEGDHCCPQGFCGGCD